jgi:diguanylate cyclase (GGDEF)-like protein
MHRKGNEYELFQNWFHAIQEKGRDPYAETTIAFIDFDNFKSVNDREGGHGTGNLVIQTITKIIRESIRNTNLSIRW